jgi:hypothetical protein
MKNTVQKGRKNVDKGVNVDEKGELYYKNSTINTICLERNQRE